MCGLGVKMNDTDFRSYMNKFHFLCLLETSVESLKTDIFSVLTYFIAPAMNLSIAGRRSGDLLLLINNAFDDCVQMIELGMKTYYYETVEPFFLVHQPIFSHWRVFGFLGITAVGQMKI